MQLTNAPPLDTFPALVGVLNAARVGRYMGAANGDANLALRLYFWNCDLSRAFYLPLHMAEITSRNAIHGALQHWLSRDGDPWYDHGTLRRTMDARFENELDKAIADERDHHGNAMTEDHVCSALTFGFWEHLTTKRFERLIWKRGIRHNFPHAGNMSRDELHDQIETVRRWRNRIAHHRAIFDKGPAAKYQAALKLIGIVCPETSAWVAAETQISQIIAARPTA